MPCSQTEIPTNSPNTHSKGVGERGGMTACSPDRHTNHRGQILFEYGKKLLVVSAFFNKKCTFT